MLKLLLVLIFPKLLFSFENCNKNLYIGATISYKYLNSKDKDILIKEFSYITPANSFKQRYIHPRPNIWRWEKSDRWIDFITKHHKIMRMHSPISPQCSIWAKNDKRSAYELEKNMQEYLTKLYIRYSKIKNIKWIDVVNETVLRNGEWNHAKKGIKVWETPWTKIGFDKNSSLKPPLYIKKAFEIANIYIKHSKLIINQNGGMEQPMWNKIKSLVYYLRHYNLRVDGIGWQAHINAGFEKRNNNLQKLSDLIDWAHSNNLEFHITENNVWLKNSKNFQQQTDTFLSLIKLLIQKSKRGVVTWNTWNLRDIENSNKSFLHGSIFFDNYRPKPVYFEIKKILKESCK